MLPVVVVLREQAHHLAKFRGGVKPLRPGKEIMALDSAGPGGGKADYSFHNAHISASERG